MSTSPAGVSLKCRRFASAMRKIVRCVTEQERAANSTVTACVSASQAAHHMADALPRIRKMVRLCVSTVILVVRFAKAHQPFRAVAGARLSTGHGHDRRDDLRLRVFAR